MRIDCEGRVEVKTYCKSRINHAEYGACARGAVKCTAVYLCRYSKLPPKVPPRGKLLL